MINEIQAKKFCITFILMRLIKKLAEAMKGKKNPLFGKYHTEETRRKISEASKRRKISK